MNHSVQAQQLCLLHTHTAATKRRRVLIMLHPACESLPDRLQPLMPVRDEEATPCPAVSERDSRARLSARPSAITANCSLLLRNEGRAPACAPFASLREKGRGDCHRLLWGVAIFLP